MPRIPFLAGLTLRHRDGTFREERFAGWGAPALHFESGDVIAFRRVVASSIGPPFATVWHRGPDARWVIHSNVHGNRSCPRYLEPSLRRVCADDIEIRRGSHREVAVLVRHARLRLGLRLAATPRTAAAGLLGRVLPRPAWQRPGASTLLARIAAGLVGAGAVALHGTTHSGHQWFIRPAGVWRVVAAAAVIDGRDLGSLVLNGSVGTLATAPGDVDAPLQPLLVRGEVLLRAAR